MSNWEIRGGWNDHNCNNEFNFICQAYTQKSHPKPTGDERWPRQGK